MMDTQEFPTAVVLDHGLIRRVKWMGTDLDIIRAARISHNAPWRAGENENNDRKLLRRLWTGKPSSYTGPLPPTPAHSTPFEAVTGTFEVLAPIFVFRQWHRHRTQSYNEASARYTELPEMFYVPDPTIVGAQSTADKQGRSFDVAVLDQREVEIKEFRSHCEASFVLYRKLLATGWPRELARCVLPLGTYSHMFTTASLLNFMRFLALRTDAHAQYEIRVYANEILNMIAIDCPETAALFREAHGL